ncbi:MAG: RNA pseudouridine synthase [Phycisphaerales bacterium]
MATPAANPAVPFHLLREERTWMVVNKPAGVVTEPGLGHQRDSLLNGLMARWPEALSAMGERRDWGLLHRLDRDTSGAVIVALEPTAYDDLRAQFERRAVVKHYLALVQGRAPAAQGTIRAPLQEVRRGDMKVSAVTPRGGEEAITRYRSLGRGNGRELLQLELVTGRLHQIRAHLAHVGCPVVNDRVYRVDLPPNTSKPPKGRPALPLALVAWSVSLAPPGAREPRSPVTVTAPLPESFTALLREAQFPVPAEPVPVPR